MKPIFYDTETCGLHGPIVLLQYALGDGDIILYEPWKRTVKETKDLIEMMMNHEDGVVGFNLAFDHFHLCQMYTVLELLPEDRILGDIIDQYAISEEKGRFQSCVKPKKCFDLMLHARKTEYQSTMDRSKITLKRIPTKIAPYIAEELSKRIVMPDILFERKKDSSERWKVLDILDNEDQIIPEFKNVQLTFAPSSALKALAKDALGVDSAILFEDVMIPKEYMLKDGETEFGFAPFCTAVGSPEDWKGAWPDVIKRHIDWWGKNAKARQYAKDDVEYTRELYKYFKEPEMDDTDSVLACQVGAVRWRGFEIDVPKLKALRDTATETLNSGEHEFNKNAYCRQYMTDILSDTEKLSVQVESGKVSTDGKVLEKIAKWTVDDICEDCLGDGCDKCDDGLIKGITPHPASLRAKEILDWRHAKKELEVLNKLLLAGRFHASFKVIGTLSSRMSGADGLNAQGMNHKKEFRECFPLAHKSDVLCGGDFSGFEVSLADAVYGDPDLREDLKSGKKIHALFGQFLFPDMTYEEILETDKLAGPANKYSRSKQGVFALLYGGEAFTLMTRVGVSEKVANEAYHKWIAKYKVWGQERTKIFDMFCSMKQPDGIGTNVIWDEPCDYIESMFGFRRYFSLENEICQTLYELAQDPPEEWKNFKDTVVRRDRKQTLCGSAQSACYATAFALQASNMRAAGNHVIQSPGATITKELQRRIWDMQEAGIHSWTVQPMNVHDEIMCPVTPGKEEEITKVVDDFVEGMRPKVPLIEMEWGINYKSWADK